MNRSKNHIIEKVSVDVNVDNESIAYKIKDNISVFFHDRVLPEVENVLDELNPGNQIIRFEKLDIDFDFRNWKQRDKMAADLSQKLRQQLLESTGVPLAAVRNGEFSAAEQKGCFVSEQQNIRSIFLFYLEKGSLPWYGKRFHIDGILTDENWPKHLADKRFVLDLQTLLRQNPKAEKRFVWKLSIKQILEFFEVTDTISPDLASLEVRLGEYRAEIKRAILSYLLAVAAKSTSQNIREKLLDVFFEWIPENTDDSSDQKEIATRFKKEFSGFTPGNDQNKLFKISEDDIENIVLPEKMQHTFRHTKRGFTQNQGSVFENKSTVISKQPVNDVCEKEPLFFGKDVGDIAVPNAGQDLFLPFLKPFFSHFNWLDKNSGIRDERRLQAVQAVHYCATGSEDFFEPGMILEKFICGLELDTPVPVESLITREIMEESDEMLAQMIKHWRALKNTSPDGLRQMFFARDGKLIRQGQNFRLIVERKAQDILLDRIPWNYTVAKLPWLKSLLMVEW